MKRKMTFVLAALILALTLAVAPHRAAAETTTITTTELCKGTHIPNVVIEMIVPIVVSILPL
jgi:hypothetical protein